MTCRLDGRGDAIEGFHVDENEYQLGLTTYEGEKKPAWHVFRDVAAAATLVLVRAAPAKRLGVHAPRISWLMQWLSCLNVLLGLWLVVAPFVLGYLTPRATWKGIIKSNPAGAPRIVEREPSASLRLRETEVTVITAETRIVNRQEVHAAQVRDRCRCWNSPCMSEHCQRKGPGR